jgi:beta-lactamase regulating signal transducer with metallopeptidase domain
MILALTSLLDLLPATTAMRLGWVCIHSVWQAAAVAALLAVALRLIPRRSTAAINARYLLAVAALFALPVLAVATFLAVPGERTSDRGLTGPAAAAVAGMPGAKEVLVMPHGAGAANSAAAASSSRTAVAVLSQDLASRVEPWLPLAAAAWVAGMLVAAVRMMAGWALTRRLVARATAVADGRWQARVNRWRRALDIDGMVRLLASDAIGAPVVVGWLKPVILWPAGALVGMGPQEIDAIIAHELAHVRRRDMLVNLLQACIDVLFFHHPAAWWISAQVRGEREHCADDLAVRALERDRAGTRLSYAKALVSLEERRMATAFAMAADGGSLVDRIRRLAGVEAPQASAARLVAGVLATACMVAVVAAGAVAPRPALAAEEQALPKDTHTIKTLTPEQARTLVEKSERLLNLNGLTSLSPEVAAVLAGFKGEGVYLDGLTTLSPEAAGALAKLQRQPDSLNCVLSLKGLTSLTPEVAKALAEVNGSAVNLSGLTTLDADTATALAGFRSNSLQLPRLTAITPEVATGLAGFRGFDLRLDGLTALSPEVATALAGAKCRELRLFRLTTLSPEAAAALAGYKGGVINFHEGLTTLSVEAATALAEYPGIIAFPEKVKKDFAARYPLNPDNARALARMVNGDLPGITALESADSVAIAEALATYKGRLSLPNLKKISPKTLSALVKKEDVQIPLIETLELIPEPDGSPASELVIPKGFKERQEAKRKEFEQSRQQPRLQLRGDGGVPAAELPKDTNAITSLTPEEAKKLAAEFKGGEHRITLNESRTTTTTWTLPDALPLDGLKSLDAETARVLATYGDRGELTMSSPGRGALLLNGLATLDAESATALAGFKGYGLWLNGLKTLSPEAATALAGFKGRDLSLAGLTTLSPEAKQALEKVKGRVHLGGLTTADAADAPPKDTNAVKTLVPAAQPAAAKDKSESAPGADGSARERALSDEEMEHLRQVVADSDFVACMTLGPAGFTGNQHRHEAKVTAICKGSPRTTVVFAAINPDPHALPPPINPPPANPLPTIAPGDYVVILSRREIINSFPLTDTLGKSYNYFINHDNRSHFAWEKHSPEAEYVRRLCMGK